MKTASALLIEEKVYVQAYSQTTTGIWIAFGPVFSCEIDNVEELTRIVRAAFEFSRSGVPQPRKEDWKNIQRPILDAVGAKNWASLAKNARAVGLECEECIIKMIPSYEYKNDGGYPLNDKAISCKVNDFKIGDNLVKAFEISS